MADHKNKAHNKQAAALAKLAARRPACFGLPTTSQSQQRCFEPFTFCVLGDPQVGFGADGVEEDGARLAAAVRRARELVGATGALLVAGDLTDAWLPAEVRALYAAFSSWPAGVPVFAALGNHDVVQTEGDPLAVYAQLANYPQYYAALHRGCRFLCLDSNALRAGAAAAEAHLQWLAEQSSGRAKPPRHSFALMHHPPFEHDPDEGSNSWNVPPDVRPRLLRLLADAGVRDILCGHRHVTLVREVQVITSDGGAVTLRIWIVGGTAKLLPGGDVDFWCLRAFSVTETGVEQTVVKLEGEHFTL
eukprot:TRINITY_DN2791_c0_g1_i2.p1 TRINITY_DN2791_c0_g1~~TRINITY_DN2791_c0_g1_i2.p1  ORF type:complete len:304 (+),score=102.14 TRINITY_DN2791_c0_g1_i2:46-957(+)